MNLLLSMPNDTQSNYYIIDALNDIIDGDVYFIDHRQNLEQAKNIVPNMIKELDIDVFLVLYLVPGYTYSSDFIREMKAKYPNVKYLSWIFDTTIQGKYCDQNEMFLEIVREYDYFFTICKEHANNIKDKNVNAYWVPEGASKYTYIFKKDFKYDVSFIGQVGHLDVHQDRVPLLGSISKKFNTIIYGPLYNAGQAILDCHKKRPTLTDIEHSKIVSQSKINIGHSGWTHLDGNFSARNYRVMAAGGFLLANRSRGMEEAFKEDVEVVLYDSKEECIDKIKYYLEHEREREEIAKRGYAKVINNYTFHNSMEKILDIIA